MGMVILRVNKLKTAGGVSRYAAHNTRERPPEHARPDLRDRNIHLVGNGSLAQAMGTWRDRVSQDEHPRKNAVIALDYLIHASPRTLTPEARENYLKDGLAWIAKRHGRENIVQATIHRDETTEAHLHVIVVPLVLHKGRRLDGKYKLNAGHWLNGRAKLTAMQTEFAHEVGRPYGLQRGIEGSRATHRTVRSFYGLLNRPYEELRVEIARPPKLGAFLDLDEWKAKEEDRIADAVNPIYKRVQAQERVAVLLHEKAAGLQATATALARERDAYRKAYDEWRAAALTMPLEQIRAMRTEETKKSRRAETTRDPPGHDRDDFQRGR